MTTCPDVQMPKNSANWIQELCKASIHSSAFWALMSASAESEGSQNSFFVCLFFGGAAHLLHMEVPRLSVHLEL